MSTAQERKAVRAFEREVKKLRTILDGLKSGKYRSAVRIVDDYAYDVGVREDIPRTLLLMSEYLKDLEEITLYRLENLET